VSNEKERPTVQSEINRLQDIGARDERFAYTSDIERAIQNSQDAQKRRLSKMDNDMRQALKHVECRRILQTLISECHVFAEAAVGPMKAFDGSNIPSDPLETYRRLGERRIGLVLMEMVERAQPGACLQMMREFVSDEKSQNENRGDQDGN
jgi:hypothetical protein